MGTGTIEGTTLTLIGMACTFAGTIATGAWWFRGIPVDLEKKTNEKIEELRDKILRETGEGLSGIRTFAAGVEKRVDNLTLETERNFVRRADFQNAIDSFTRSISDLRSEIRQEYGRLNDKLDQVIQGKAPSHR
jgi:hypothetical protein